MARHYPGGATITVDGSELELGSNWDERRKVLTIKPNSAEAHTLRIEPKP